MKRIKYYIFRLYSILNDNFRDLIIRIYVCHYINRGSKNLIIGFVFSDLGGVPHHINALAKYSSHNPIIIPDPKHIKKINAWKKQDVFKTSIEKRSKCIQYKIFHSHVDSWFIDLCEKAKVNGSKWVHTYHTLYFEQDWDKGLKDWQKETNEALIEKARKADVRISISKWLKQHLEEKYGINTIYIPNGVSNEKCDKAESGRFFSKYPFRDFVLFASGISDVKNPVDFIKLAGALSDIQFVMIGRQLSVEALISKYNISIPHNLHVVGRMPHSELLDAIAACKVFVVTSRSEGLPTVLMEAMALQRAVVGCDTYGTKEVIGSEEFGYIYDHNSFEDLVIKTKMAMNDTEKGALARKRVLENYDWRVVIPQIDEIYSNLLNAKN